MGYGAMPKEVGCRRDEANGKICLKIDRFEVHVDLS